MNASQHAVLAKKTEHVTHDVWIPHAQYCSYVESYTNGVLQRRYEKFIRLYDRRNEDVRLGEEQESRNIPLEPILSCHRDTHVWQDT